MGSRFKPIVTLFHSLSVRGSFWKSLPALPIGEKGAQGGAQYTRSTSVGAISVLHSPSQLKTGTSGKFLSRASAPNFWSVIWAPIWKYSCTPKLNPPAETYTPTAFSGLDIREISVLLPAPELVRVYLHR